VVDAPLVLVMGTTMLLTFVAMATAGWVGLLIIGGSVLLAAAIVEGLYRMRNARGTDR
jgi:hypothetical protein